MQIKYCQTSTFFIRYMSFQLFIKQTLSPWQTFCGNNHSSAYKFRCFFRKKTIFVIETALKSSQAYLFDIKKYRITSQITQAVFFYQVKRKFIAVNPQRKNYRPKMQKTSSMNVVYVLHGLVIAKPFEIPEMGKYEKMLAFFRSYSLRLGVVKLW